MSPKCSLITRVYRNDDIKASIQGLFEVLKFQKLMEGLLQEVKSQHDPELLVLETDNVIFKDDGFR